MTDREEDSRPPIGGFPSLALLLAILVLAAGLRFYHLTFQSLWYDELFSVVFSHPDRSVGEIVRTYRTDFHPLAYPLLVHVWLILFGATELTARLLSAVVGVASVGAMYLFGRRALDHRVGLIAALLTAVNAFHLAYSQEVRSYSLLFLLAALSFAALLQLLERPHPTTVGAYILATGLVLHTHYYGLIFTGAQLAAASVVVLARDRSWRALRPLAFAASGLALVCLPWLGPLLRAARTTDYWPAPPGPGFAAEYFHLYFGKEPLLTLLFALLLISLPILLRARPETIGEPAEGLSTRAVVVLLSLAVLLVLLVPYLWSVAVVPMLIPRCTIVALPALLVLAALAVRQLPSVWLRRSTLAFITLVSLSHLFLGSRYYETVRKEQWREAARWAWQHPDHRHPDDRYVADLAPGFQFYFDQDGVGAVVEPATPKVLRSALQRRDSGGGVWLLVARGRRGGPEFRRLLERRYRRVVTRSFHQTAAEYWRPRQAGNGSSSTP